ncbi:MAG: hypothetical protein KJN97_12900, partial [Deltaproteobacteria bacterium]|nr:hypothetical protein [Deltaproteobacteria bacterium]
AHDRVVHDAVESCGGRVFKHTGDGFACVFESARDAICAAVQAQHSLTGIEIGDGPLKARMAVHSGPAEERDDDYFGPALNRVARLMAAGYGGQILCSLATHQLAIDSLGDGLGLVSLGSHRLRDLSRAEEIFQLVGDGLDSDFPPIKTPDVAPNNLPIALTPFIGREAEVRQAITLLEGSRLLTVTGVGGSGKTRLAVQVGATLADSVRHGVWLVELASLTDGTRVVPTIAETLGVEEIPGTALLDSIVERLGGTEALLILDNCEHLLDPCAETAESLLGRLPHLRVIATSREVLSVPGETAFGLRSMSLPALDAPLEDLDEYDAIQLFVDRAMAASPTFHLASAATESVVEVCRRLDGMPLAIELAAARVRSLTVQQLAENLDKRFRLLTGGSRTALPRQQTLAAAIDWSYRLLNDDEKLLFQRLSVFQGGFDIEAAQTICGGDGIDEFDVLDLVSSLVDKSLVVAETGYAAARYHFLETIRQFARDRLDESGHGEPIRLTHAAYFTELAESIEGLIGGDQEGIALAMAEADLDNIRHAMDWAVMSENADLTMRTAVALGPFWMRSVRHVEASEWLERSRSAREGHEDLLQTRATINLGFMLSQSRQTAGLALFDQGIAKAREFDVEDDEARRILMTGLSNRTLVLESLGRLEEAEADSREAREIARGFDPYGYSVTTGNVAEYTSMRGDLDEASELFAESVATADELGRPSRRFDARWQAANFERCFNNNPTAAERLYGEAVELGRSIIPDAWIGLLSAHQSAAGLQLGKEGAYEEFLTAARACLDVPDFSAYGAPSSLLVFRSEFDASRGDYRRAAKVLGAIQAMGGDGVPAMSYHQNVIAGVAQQAEEALGESDYQTEFATGLQLRMGERLALITEE